MARRNQRFDADVIVIGAGSAGLVSAYIGAALKARVVLVESGEMGGDCLNTGCVPSKALIAAARRAHHARDSAGFGVDVSGVRVDFERVKAHVRRAIASIAPNDSVERYTRLGVRCLRGEARLVDPWTIDVEGQRVRGRNIVIAAGADPVMPPVPGLADSPCYTTDTIWDMPELPQRLAVLGGGPVGCELSQAFARLGARVSQFEMQPRLLGGEDPCVGDLLKSRFEREGIAVHTGTRVESVSGTSLCFDPGDGRVESRFDAILVATGRRPRVDGFGLEALGVEIRAGRVGVNAFMQTNFPHIYACGDIAGPYQFTHAASHQAWHATVNALLRPFWRFRIGYDQMPWAVYTDPEIGRVGLDEAAAAERGLAVETTRFDLADLDRAVAEHETDGFLKLVTRRGSDRLLGAVAAGAHAGEIASMLALAMKHRVGVNGLLSTLVPYPAWSEAIKRGAGQWKQAHAPAWIFPWLARYHRFRRGNE